MSNIEKNYFTDIGGGGLEIWPLFIHRTKKTKKYNWKHNFESWFQISLIQSLSDVRENHLPFQTAVLD